MQLGCDLVGFAPTHVLEAKVAPAYCPSNLGEHFESLIVVAKRSYAGFLSVHHAGTKQFWGGRIVKRLDETCVKLAETLERQGAVGFPVSSLMVDMGERKGVDLCPAGQGSPLLKAAAVAAGLGTLGLNTMLLTPEFGPRVYLGGVLTDALLPAGAPATRELCLGLEECGRCAAVCPEDAIPRRGRRDAPVAEQRGLDTAACARSSQGLGPAKFEEHLRSVLAARGDRESMWSLIGSRLTGALWQEMLMVKEGAFTGCSACVHSCPVGDDHARASERGDVTSQEVERTVIGDVIEVQRLPRSGGEAAE
jgi:epoxyqueuosine reductase